MNKKHFIALAAEFRSQLEAYRGASGNCLTPDRAELAINSLKDAVACVSRVARQDNPRFDEARFLAACGL